jgi:porin
MKMPPRLAQIPDWRLLVIVGGLAAAFPHAARADDNAAAAPSVDLTVAYTGETWSLLGGGLRRGERYVDNLDVQLTVDLEKSIGWSGAKAFVYGLYNNGTAFSGDLVGDLQGVSNIETGIEALRLYEAWVDQTFAAGHGSVRFGLYDLNSEFDASLVRSLFINPSHGIGPDFGQAGLNGPSIFPATSLATRVSWTFDGGAYVRLAVLDGVPNDPNHPKRTTIDLRGRDGALIAAEAGLSSENGRLLSIGVWDFTAAFDDLIETTSLGNPVRRHDNRGAYVGFEDPIWSREEHDPFDLAGFVRAGVASDDVNPIASYVGLGFVATGPFEARPADKLGIALAIANVGDKYRALIQASSGSSAAREINLEVTYQLPLMDGLVVQPDLQWINNPGANASIRDAFVVGVRFKVDHNWSD